MLEIRFHGRGGQGAVVASKILADALFHEGKMVQAFPAFGVERRGAPVAAFIRIDDRPIMLRNEIYVPDQIVILDHTLVKNKTVFSGLKKGGLVLINTALTPEKFVYLGDYSIFTVDANRIAAEHRLGSPSAPIVNTSILGAYAGCSKICSIDSICRAIEEYVPSNKKGNVDAAVEACRSVKGCM
jgi:2-oxoacid:acceptor oxidoreductase gamma subunit (pyruvate/2-ketoisovalerate family)